MKKKAKEREREGGDTDPKLVIPALARVENRAYKPGILFFYFVFTFPSHM